MLDKITKNKLKTTGVSDFMQLEISNIYPNADQPRKDFKEIEELASSISLNGLIQPIAVIKKNDKYMIISGERRYKAHLFLKLKTIKAHIIKASDTKIQELALIENIQRDDLTDFEKAKFIGSLWASGNYKQKQDLAKAIGKNKTYISKSFSCLKLDSLIIKDIENNKQDISLSVLEEIARVKDKNIQQDVYKKYLSKEIVRDDIKKYKNSPTVKKTKKIMYGFGTQNHLGTYIAITKGDATGTITFDEKFDITNSVDINYKITIEEL